MAQDGSDSNGDGDGDVAMVFRRSDGYDSDGRRTLTLTNVNIDQKDEEEEDDNEDDGDEQEEYGYEDDGDEEEEFEYEDDDDDDAEFRLVQHFHCLMQYPKEDVETAIIHTRNNGEDFDQRKSTIEAILEGALSYPYPAGTIYDTYDDSEFKWRVKPEQRYIHIIICHTYIHI